MLSRKLWNLGIIVLLLLLVGLLLQFLLATLRIRELALPADKGAPGQALPHVVLIAQVQDNPFWRTIERGAREAAETFGMELEYRGPLRIQPQEQIRLLEKALASRADAVLIQGINDPAHRALIDKAMLEGIPVITIDADEPDSRRLAYIGTDNRKAGETMGELLARKARGEGTVGVLIGSPQAYSQQLRLAGFRSVISRYPELRIAEVRSTDVSRLQAAQQTEELLALYPQMGYLAGFSALDGMGALEAASRLRPQGLGIFAFDDLPETKEAVAACRIESTVVQQPYQMGYGAVALLHDYFQGRPVASEHFTEAGVYSREAIDSADASAGGACP
ncbi:MULTISPECIES: substrate-binding domain-containing protein [Paenibacillus]|uniref:substrate-binding domain-containing protein n=1 Tax=Paenibacillus TaxID=44249 RepID=UPI0022B8E864|nr:substrate-binding domain-containing protein [Paenibacillus caseinilyticus]MCZ8522659.1 substrate-binding domain-containing protein [Paenibacillus caseinilyticus]